MKPWAWLLLSILTVAGSVYVLKKPDASPEPTSSDPSLVVPPPPMVGDSLSQPRQPGQPGQNVPLNRNIPAPRGPVTGNSDNMGANPPQSPPNNEENNPSYPTIPPPPPPPGSPFPDAEPPEYY
ncbi:hypothetical protein EBT16_12480, partial [bacterium]|nr:hypothetical protein [bacterium]